jgi:hypothetical protein
MSGLFQNVNSFYQTCCTNEFVIPIIYWPSKFLRFNITSLSTHLSIYIFLHKFLYYNYTEFTNSLFELCKQKVNVTLLKCIITINSCKSTSALLRKIIFHILLPFLSEMDYYKFNSASGYMVNSICWNIILLSQFGTHTTKYL